MRVGEILSDLRKQRRRIDRAIAALEILKPQSARQGKKRTNRRKPTSGTARSGKVYRLSRKRGTVATEGVSRPARVIPFGRLRQRA
jgi:hypothetical protein